jgi:hypothetical protein
LLFHARERGAEPLIDTPLQRVKGWKRILLFANYFRPGSVSVPHLSELLADVAEAEQRQPATHFGVFPFRWSENWEDEADLLIANTAGDISFGLAPVLERLVFVRSKGPFLAWLDALSKLQDIRQLIPAHYDASMPISSASLAALAELIKQRTWAPSEGPWQLLASIDSTLIQWRLVPQQNQDLE